MPRRVSAPPARPAAPAAPPTVRTPKDVEALLAAASALRRSDGPEGAEALLTSREAARVRAALAKAPKAAQAEVLRLAGGFRGDGAAVASALLLRAVAARADRLSEPPALSTLRRFAGAMQCLDAATLRERATVLDLDSRKDTSGFDAQTLWERRGTVRAPAGRRAADDDGLLQRFTSTCGPTVLQMVMAEADPVLAFAITGRGRASASARDATADFQRAVLEEFGGVGLPRLEAALASRLKNALGRLVASGDVTGAQRDALLRHARADGALDAGAKAALAAVRARYDGFPADAALEQLRTAVLPARDVGLGTDELRRALEKYASHLTGLGYRQTEPADGFGRGQARRHLDAVERALASGADVPFGVCEPAHWMLLTAVRPGAAGREFLVSDPDGGRTAWVAEKDLVSGAFGDRQFHLNKPGERPYIDCFYLPAEA